MAALGCLDQLNPQSLADIGLGAGTNLQDAVLHYQPPMSTRRGAPASDRGYPAPLLQGDQSVIGPLGHRSMGVNPRSGTSSIGNSISICAGQRAIRRGVNTSVRAMYWAA